MHFCIFYPSIILAKPLLRSICVNTKKIFPWRQHLSFFRRWAGQFTGRWVAKSVAQWGSNQSEASIQVTWSLSTNQRRAWGSLNLGLPICHPLTLNSDGTRIQRTIGKLDSPGNTDILANFTDILANFTPSHRSYLVLFRFLLASFLLLNHHYHHFYHHHHHHHHLEMSWQSCSRPVSRPSPKRGRWLILLILYIDIYIAMNDLTDPENVFKECL